MTDSPVQQPQPVRSQARPYRILVVDDDEPKRYSMVRWLTHAGYAVDEAATGEEGLARLAGHDAVVLDVHLPDLSGFDVCRQMRRRAPAVPIVQVSAVFTQESYRAAGRLAGASSYLTELDGDDLLHAVESALQRRFGHAGNSRV